MASKPKGVTGGPAAAGPDVYLDLVKRFPLRPIRSASQLERAYAVIDELSIRGEDDLDAGELDYLLVLGDLTSRYEEREAAATTVGAVTGLDILKHLVEANGLTGSDLGRVVGQRELGAKLLNGDRQISKGHAKLLGEHFGLPPETFLR